MKLTLVMLALSLSANAWANPQARSLCENELVMNGPTKKIAAYLSSLLERKLIGDKELVALLSGLNPISATDASLRSALLIHREKLEKMLGMEGIERENLSEWALRSLKDKELERAKRAEAEKDTKVAVQEIETLQLTIEGRKVEVMPTLVTQEQWVRVMGENPSAHHDGPGSVVWEVEGRKVQLLPDHPVESVSWWSAVEFANRLSVKQGLKPVYDLSKVELVGRAEDGSLRRKSEPRESEYPFEASLGSNAEAEGFRLPAFSEQNYLIFLGNEYAPNFFDPQTNPVEDYAWSRYNANNTTHAVAQLRPTVIEGKNFYDIFGNVEEWGNSFRVNHRGKFVRDVRGGYSGTLMQNNLPSLHDQQLPDTASRYTGFRLVRTVK